GTPDPFQILNGAAVEGRNCYNVALGGSVPGGADDNPPPNLIALLKIPVNAAATYAPLPKTGVVALSQLNGMDISAAAGWGGVTVAGGTQAQIQGNTLYLNQQAVATLGYQDPGKPPAHFDAPDSGVPSSLWLPSTDKSMEVPDPMGGGDMFNIQYMTSTSFLTGALVLNGGFYYFDGSLVNRASQYVLKGPPPPPPPPRGWKGAWNPPQPKGEFDDSGTYIVSNGGTLKLVNTVLVVSGDCDVAGIDGENSVLIVGGRLTLTGGQMNAENKGIVILANHVVLRADGKFLGLVISQSSLESFTYNPKGLKLSVRGGLLSATSMTLSNTDVQWDPYFLQLLNRFGSITTSLFRQITQ
ncbi:MAG: hypothetical protein ACYCW6_06875, partial [Candidatus Xenobia bacterium]